MHELNLFFIVAVFVSRRLSSRCPEVGLVFLNFMFSIFMMDGRRSLIRSPSRCPEVGSRCPEVGLAFRIRLLAAAAVRKRISID